MNCQYIYAQLHKFSQKKYNFVMSKIVNEIKNLTNDRDMTLKQLAQKIGEAQNKEYSLASLSQKLRNETISYKEIKLIAQILGYKIKFIDTKTGIYF